MILKIVFFVFIAFGVTTITAFECSPKFSYQENGCATCFCIIKGTDKIGCTPKTCNNENYLAQKNCEVGTEWKQGDEQCWCVQSFGTICTVKPAHIDWIKVPNK